MNKIIKCMLLSSVLNACFMSYAIADSSLKFNDLSAGFQDNNQLSNDPAIIRLLKEEKVSLNKEFPFRMNIFKNGKVDENSAGVRVSEQAKQIAKNNAGLVFYYELLPNAMRVPHWHANANELGVVTSGSMRVEIWNGLDKPTIYYVHKGETWIIPQGTLHSLENVGKDKLSFIVIYDHPVTADRDFITAWASLPKSMLSNSVGLSESELAHIQKTTNNPLSNYQPQVESEVDYDPLGYNSDLNKIKPIYNSELGSIVRLSKTQNSNMFVTLQRTILKSGSMRTPHWYTNGDELLYVQDGIGFISMMDDDGNVYHKLVQRGDLISIPVGNFFGFINVGRKDLEVYEVLKTTEQINEITLLGGTQQLNKDVIQGATGLSEHLAEKLLNQKSLDPIIKFKN
ncbi:MAG: cupin domain-containing protein [Proteobacteria bacterium]|nr:MAG: cupin domain-containing protein [Pseudomonadota bacterium]